MTDLRTAAQMALTLVDDLETDKIITEQEAETLRAALTQGEHEPYGYLVRRNWKEPRFVEASNIEGVPNLPFNNPEYLPLYTAPQQREEMQEPVAWMCPDDPEQETAFSWKAGHCVDCGRQRVPVYTAPPQRGWQGLTDDEIRTAASLGIYEKPLIEFARAIEAKLKKKNT